MELKNHIEALLFLSGEPLEISRFCSILKKTESEVEQAINELQKDLELRGIRLIKNSDKIMLGTAPEASEHAEALIKEEFDRNIGKAGLETLAVVLYKGSFSENGISRADIDYIRGVNSTFTLRNLSIRGLVERRINPKDKRSFVYTPSMQLLQYLGITKTEDMPKFEEFKKRLEVISDEKEAINKNETSNLTDN